MKDDNLFLEHMLQGLREVTEFAARNSDDLAIERAIERSLQILGEAARNISREFQNANPTIAWKDIIGLRHRIVHDYFGIDKEVLKDVVKNDLPLLEEQITALLENGKPLRN